MAHVEDRWMVPGPAGKKVRGPRYGQGSRWLAVWHEPDGSRRKRAMPTKDAAVAHIEHVGVDKRTGAYITVASGALTVADMAAQWTAAHTSWSASTAARNTDILRTHVLPRWGPVRLDDVREEAVQDWVNTMTVATSTRRRIHQVLSGVLTLAVRRKHLAFNPALHVDFPASDARPKRALTVREVDLFVAAHPEPWQTWARFLAFTGLRVSEAAGLRVQDVDLTRRRVTVTEAVVVVNGRKIEQTRVKTETSQGRRVPLVGELVPLLEPLVHGRAPAERVFTLRGGSTVNRANYSRRQFRAAITEIGHPEMQPHELRHTAVSLAIASGASVKSVQAIAGHKDAAMTLNVYAHLFDDDLDAVTAAMDRRIALARAEPPRSPQVHLVSP